MCESSISKQERTTLVEGFKDEYDDFRNKVVECGSLDEYAQEFVGEVLNLAEDMKNNVLSLLEEVPMKCRNNDRKLMGLNVWRQQDPGVDY